MIRDFMSTSDGYMTWLRLPRGTKSKPGTLAVMILFLANAHSLQGDIKLFHNKEGSGPHAHYILLPPVPWQDTKSSRVLGPSSCASSGTQVQLFHQVISFVAQNGDDQVHLGDFVIFCYPTCPDADSKPLVSNIYIWLRQYTDTQPAENWPHD